MCWARAQFAGKLVPASMLTGSFGPAATKMIPAAAISVNKGKVNPLQPCGSSMPHDAVIEATIKPLVPFELLNCSRKLMANSNCSIASERSLRSVPERISTSQFTPAIPRALLPTAPTTLATSVPCSEAPVCAGLLGQMLSSRSGWSVWIASSLIPMPMRFPLAMVPPVVMFHTGSTLMSSRFHCEPYCASFGST